MTNPQGVIINPSPYSVRETIDRLEAFLRQRGVTIYARINQQAELQKAGETIPPLEFILFGNPKAGGPIMKTNPIAALDLPLKVIAWENEKHEVFVAYNDALYIEDRYALPHNPASPLNLAILIETALKP